MNHLVYLDARAGELEKILSGVKTMLTKEFDPAQSTVHPVRPGDSLFFLKDTDDGSVRVAATVARVLPLTGSMDEGLSGALKEMQPRLQLTEGQFDYWSARQQALLVEFDSAHKIEVIRVAPRRIADAPVWIAFEELRDITEQEIAP